MQTDNKTNSGLTKPRWLRRGIPRGRVFQDVHHIIAGGRLNTVCREALCPNLSECYARGTAAFLILGGRCTRDCRFCAVEHGPEGLPDPDEPARLAEAVTTMGLRYVVVTSVTRDDLPDGGARQFALTIGAIRDRAPDVPVEVLIPDFQGDAAALRTVIDAGPDVLNHNLETVPRLYDSARPQADYRRSLDLLRRAGEIAPGLPVKTGLMLGMGETAGEVRDTLRDILAAGCRMLTIGQYLAPSDRHLPVARYVPPEEFDGWREEALTMGFSEVASGPFVRSSYRADVLFGTHISRR